MPREALYTCYHASAMSTYYVRTFGCQMNKHDSERIAGMLEASGLSRAADMDGADVIVFNTCAVREGAEERLRGQVSTIKPLKAARPGTLIAVGGCVAQKDAEGLAALLPHVDVVFGTHNIDELPALLDAARETRTAQIRVLGGSEGFASDLPSRRDRPWSAWLPVTVGCDNRCSYCIVPAVRGPERSRPFEDIVEEAARLVEDGVVEITLLGQNVNSYGRDRYGEPRFAELLREVAGASGVDWLRFTTSHPKDLSAQTIRAMAETPQVCRYLHLPAQSGSDRILELMRRRYTSEHYLDLVRLARQAMPDLALSGDIIVGFPGETEKDFDDTMRLVEAADYDQLFTFVYSPRAGTPAAEMPGRVPRDVVQRRFERLVESVHRGVLAHNVAYEGTVRTALVEDLPDPVAGTLKGRTTTNKVVHVEPGAARDGWPPAPGSFVEVGIDEAHTWFLRGTLRG
jgi:tRNA-2-methylthio-N6-dimethylallyladenosine synthase